MPTLLFACWISESNCLPACFPYQLSEVRKFHIMLTCFCFSLRESLTYCIPVTRHFLVWPLWLKVLHRVILLVLLRWSTTTVIAINWYIHYSINHCSRSAYTTQSAPLLPIAIYLIDLQLTMYFLAHGNVASVKLLTHSNLGWPLLFSYAHTHSLRVVHIHKWYKHILKLADRKRETGKLSQWRGESVRRVILHRWI